MNKHRHHLGCYYFINKNIYSLPLKMVDRGDNRGQLFNTFILKLLITSYLFFKVWFCALTLFLKTFPEKFSNVLAASPQATATE